MSSGGRNRSETHQPKAAAYLVVLWARGVPMWSLGQFVDALRRPHFTLYFGRKACPLSAPAQS